MSNPIPEKIEVKLAFVSEDTAKAMAALGLNDPPKEERRICFFDTAKLALFGRGLILRVRQTVTGGDADDVTLKVRGPGASDGRDVPDETKRVPLLTYPDAWPAAWPRADYLIGNPPFLGTARMREDLGDGYTEALRVPTRRCPRARTS